MTHNKFDYELDLISPLTYFFNFHKIETIVSKTSSQTPISYLKNFERGYREPKILLDK